MNTPESGAVWRRARFWSLWDMLQWNASRLVAVTAMLRTYQEIILRVDGNRNEAVGASSKKIVRDTLNELQELAAPLSLPLTTRSIGRANEVLRSNTATWTDLNEMYVEIERRLQDELELRVVFCLDADKARFYAPEAPLFGQSVQDSFPSAIYEIEEAGKCFAFGRATACVTHLMRALEPGLNSLASELGVSFEHKNWHNILDEIEKAIRAKNAVRHAPGWKDDAQFFSEAASYFRLLKDAWRNHTMHLRDKYDPERAEAVMYTVRSFMQHLATRLSEPPESNTGPP